MKFIMSFLAICLTQAVYATAAYGSDPNCGKYNVLFTYVVQDFIHQLLK